MDSQNGQDSSEKSRTNSLYFWTCAKWDKHRIEKVERYSIGKQSIKCRWVFNIKPNSCKKACLVAKGFSQYAGTDYSDIYSPVVHFETVRLMLGLAALEKWHITGLDVQNIYLYETLDVMIDLIDSKCSTHRLLLCFILLYIFNNSVSALLVGHVLYSADLMFVICISHFHLMVHRYIYSRYSSVFLMLYQLSQMVTYLICDLRKEFFKRVQARFR